jgi:hypothetical protein
MDIDRVYGFCVPSSGASTSSIPKTVNPELDSALPLPIWCTSALALALVFLLLRISDPDSATRTLFRRLGRPLAGENIETGEPRLEDSEGGGT